MIDIHELTELVKASVKGRVGKRYQARFGTSDVAQESAVQLIKEFRKEESSPEESEHDQDGGVEPPPQKDRPVARAWLKRIGMGHAAKLRRRNNAMCRSIERETEFDPNWHIDSQAPDQIAELREITAQLVLALAKLDSNERFVIEQHYRSQKTLSEIAIELQVSRKSAQRIHLAAIKKLSLELSESGRHE